MPTAPTEHDNIEVAFSAGLRRLVGNRDRARFSAETLGGVIDAIDSAHPGFRRAVLSDDGNLKSYLVVFIGKQDARELGGLLAPLEPGASVLFLQAVAGG